MRSIFGIFLVLLMAMPHGFAQLNSYSRAELAFDNALTGYNPGFESGTVKWTGSGGTFTINSTAADQFVAGSKQFAVWDSDGAAQERCSALVKVPESGNCAVSLTYKTPSGTATHKIVAKDGSKDLAVEDVLSSTAAWRHDVEFPCAAAASNQARVCIRSVASNEPAIHLDGGYAGHSRTVAQCGVDTPWASYTPIITGFGTVTSNAAEWRKVGDSVQVRGFFISGTPTAVTGRIGLPSGQSLNVSNPSLLAQSRRLGSITRAGSSLPTASTTVGPHSLTNDNGTLTSVAISLNTATSANHYETVLGNAFAISGQSVAYEFEAPIVGWAASQCVTPEQQGWFAAGSISGANPSLGTSAVSSFAEITNGSLTLTPLTGSAAVGIMCSSTNAAAAPTTSASTCSAGNESLGFNTNVPRSGFYEVCFNASNDVVVSSGNGAFVTLQVVRTATNAQTILAEGGARTQGGHQGMTISGGTNAISSTPYRNCGFFELSAGINGFRLMYEQSIQGSGPSVSVIAADADAGSGQRNVSFSMKPVTAQQQAILANSVSTKYQSGVTEETAIVTCSSSSGIDRQLGTWVSSVGNISSGACSITVNGFGGTPYCDVNGWGTGISNVTVRAFCSSSTACEVSGYNTATGVAATAFTAKFSCKAQR